MDLRPLSQCLDWSHKSSCLASLQFPQDCCGTVGSQLKRDSDLSVWRVWATSFHSSHWCPQREMHSSEFRKQGWASLPPMTLSGSEVQIGDIFTSFPVSDCLRTLWSLHHGIWSLLPLLGALPSFSLCLLPWASALPSEMDWFYFYELLYLVGRPKFLGLLFSFQFISAQLPHLWHQIRKVWAGSMLNTWVWWHLLHGRWVREKVEDP